MRSVWKFTLSTKKFQRIKMPKGAEIISCSIQNEKPMIWAIVDKEQDEEERHFELVATGGNISGIKAKFIGSFHFTGGKIVQHLFEVEPLNFIIKDKSVSNKVLKERKSETYSSFNFNIFKSKKQKVLSEKELINKIKGTLYGHAIGDAIGLATEFMTKEQVDYYYPDGVNSYGQIICDKHRKSWTPGEWTDDTEQMLCILDSLLDKKEIDQLDIAQRIHYWAYNGGRGIGNTTYKVLSSPGFLTAPSEIAKYVWEQSGRHLAANGAVMRTSVLGLWTYSNDENVVKNAEKVAKITHFDPRCTGSSAIISLTIAKLLQGFTDFDAILTLLKPLSEQFDKRIVAYIDLAQNRSISNLALSERNSIGYTLKTMAAGLWALKQNNFKKCIQEIIHEGGDADTNAAVAGAVLGAKLGFDKLPEEWLQGLINKEKLEAKVNDFIDLLKAKNYFS